MVCKKSLFFVKDVNRGNNCLNHIYIYYDTKQFNLYISYENITYGDIFSSEFASNVHLSQLVCARKKINFPIAISDFFMNK